MQPLCPVGLLRHGKTIENTLNMTTFLIFCLLAYLLVLCLAPARMRCRLFACPNPFDVLRMKVEDLGPRLYKRATWLDPWLNLVPREEWPVGAGLVRSSFEVGRSEPTTEEESWSAITVNSGSTFVGSCLKNFTDTNVGYEERQYNPEAFWLRGPLVCQSDLTLHWNSVDFWNLYFMRLEQRNTPAPSSTASKTYIAPMPRRLLATRPARSTSPPATRTPSLPASPLTSPTSPRPNAALTSPFWTVRCIRWSWLERRQKIPAAGLALSAPAPSSPCSSALTPATSLR